LFLGKIIKIVASRCQILRLKCTKIDFGAGGAYSAPQTLSWNKGDLFLREMEGRREGERRKGEKRRGGEKNGREDLGKGNEGTEVSGIHPRVYFPKNS